MSKETIHFSFVVHKGFLETQSVLLVCSILDVYGSNVKLYAGIPKHLGGIESGISSKFKKILTELGVEFFEVTNPIGDDYPIGNKLDCFAKVDSGIKIFLDTDMIFLNKLDLSHLPKNCIAMKPADRKTYKWSDDDWKYAYGKYSKAVQSPIKMYSTCFHELMFPYYNAGMIIVKDYNNFNKEWCSISRLVDNDKYLENKRPWLDQLVLPLVIRKNNYHVINLSEKCNYPAHLKTVTENLPCVVHYHWPSILSRDYQLIKYVKKLTSSFPILSNVFKSSSKEWQDLNTIVNGDEKSIIFNKNKASKNVIITGIPRSGTSYLCSLLSKYDDSLVLNEPKEVIKPINRQPIPYGINGFYAEIRRNIRLNKPIENKHTDGKLVSDTVQDDQRNPYSKQNLNINYHLFTKNTLGYMFAIERLKQAMPNSKIFALFRNPVDTIASWKNSFEHLKMAKPNELKTIRIQHRWLNKKDNLTLMQINSCEDSCLRRALFWNYLAVRLIKNSHLIKIIHYDDLILNPNTTINKIRDKILQNQEDINLESSEIRSKRLGLSDIEIEIIENTTNNIYHELLSLKS